VSFAWAWCSLASDSSGNSIGARLPILKGREGKMNGQIIRYLALNGPSLIYSVHKDLESRSQTKVHYPTVNRRMHDLELQQYVEKAGKRDTKAGTPADLYATTLRGEFVAFAGVTAEYSAELSPNELRQLIDTASARRGSPFLLFSYILQDSPSGIDLIDNELMPEVITSVRNGYLNVDASNNDVICSAFASAIARKMTNLITPASSKQRFTKTKETHQDYVDILIHSIERIIAENNVSKSKKDPDSNARINGTNPKSRFLLSPLSIKWANELKVFLKLHPAMFD